MAAPKLDARMSQCRVLGHGCEPMAVVGIVAPFEYMGSLSGEYLVFGGHWGTHIIGLR